MSLSKADVVRRYLPADSLEGEFGQAYAPSNIALCKYWGKRDAGLNLPVNGSLSVSLAHLGTYTRIKPSETGKDCVLLNGIVVDENDSFAKKVINFIDLFRGKSRQPVCVDTRNTIPTAAGLASSASGFAALSIAVAQFYQLTLDTSVLSAFARMGSGSASRSLFHGFAQWYKGSQADGMDSFAEPLAVQWPDLRIGLVKVSVAQKSVDSRAGMNRTRDTATLYKSWPEQAETDIVTIRDAIMANDFKTMAQCAEQNAMSMHATMIASWPPLLYWQPESVAAMHKVWQLREQGVEVYFTMDAGPNLKLLFEAKDQSTVLAAFGAIDVIEPFAADVPNILSSNPIPLT